MKLLRTGKPTKSNTIPECCILQRCCSVRLKVTLGWLQGDFPWHFILFFRGTDQVQTPKQSRPLQSLAPHHMQLLESCLEHRGVVLCFRHGGETALKHVRSIEITWWDGSESRGRILPVESIGGVVLLKQIETLWAFLAGCTWRCLQNWNSKATDNYLGVRSQFRSNGCSWLPGAMYTFVSEISRWCSMFCQCSFGFSEEWPAACSACSLRALVVLWVVEVEIWEIPSTDWIGGRSVQPPSRRTRLRKEMNT